MRPDDVEAAEQITARAFAAMTGSSERSPAAKRRWATRARHILATDPDGCWVADDTSPVGVAVSLRRDLLWILSSYAVDPDQQGRGVGRALLDAAIDYGRGCLRGMLCALPASQALRRYRQAGFTLYPAMKLAGHVDRGALPDVEGVRVATEPDLDLIDSVDRQVRGATHRQDHRIMAADGPVLVCDLLTGSGYAYVNGDGIGPVAATSRTIAQRLLWAALAQTSREHEVTVRYLTSEQDWALDVGLAAGLRIEMDGCVALRHMRPPRPYVPSVPFG